VTNITFNNFGGPEVLKVVTGDTPIISAEQVLVRHTAIPVTKVDIQQRQGAFNNITLPEICGIAACGVIERVGDNVGSYNVGDRVAYVTGPFGSYCTKRAVEEKYLIRMPDDIDDATLAAALYDAMIAHYLTHRAYVVSSGIAILVHNAASVVGQYITNWARSVKAVIIGTVGFDEHKQIAVDAGCYSVFNYKTEDWVKGVFNTTNGYALNAVYDGLGKQTLISSIDCLQPCGILLCYEQAPGSLGSLDLAKLQERSLFLTCPSITNYKKNRKELLLSAEDIFNAIRNGTILVNIAAKYSLQDAAMAQSELESGNTIGSIILIP
jgi:NADPH2:quinone reductase